MSDDGIAVKLNVEKEVFNMQVLSLNGGPWNVGGHIVGMDKWSPLFNPNSFKGITASVWIHLPCLPLYYWDEENTPRNSSSVGVPMFVDGNCFKWGKHDFARVCVRLKLANRLPNGVWVDGIAGRFFQKIEYEKIDLICYHYGKAGHDRKGCPDGVMNAYIDQPVKNLAARNDVGGLVDNKTYGSEYSPWIHVQFKNRMFRKGKFARGGRSGRKAAEVNVQVHDVKDVAV
ncbi:uncharacterized protein LOC110102231 [Dendrobium catenatum]|uniref:uncharacterized protein LOC110102231 n=1 Tax=Dendrobium catenatum TaxID=906689 RepID=UPI00109F98C6|nr:uncharacterized protein LOC110102231 [Dendrobium catenatum]